MWSEAGRRWINPRQRAHVVAALSVLGALFVWLPVLTFPGREWATPWVVAGVWAGLLVGECLRLHLERRGQTYTISLGEVPLVVGAFLLSPPSLLVGFVLASVVVNAWRRLAPVKVVFNAGIYAAQAGLLVLALQVLAPGESLSAVLPAAWVGALVGITAGGILTAWAVAQAIAFVQGGAPDATALRGMLVTTLGTGFLGTTTALLILIVLDASLTAGVLIAVLLVALGFAYSSYSRLLRRRASLERFNALASRMHDAVSPDDLVITALEETAELFGAGRALLWLSNATPEAVDELSTSRTATGGWSVPERSVVVLEQGSPPGEAVAGRHTLLARGEQGSAGRWAAALGSRDAIVVPLVGSRTVLGALAVLGREGSAQSWDVDDLALLETAASHVGVALENSHLLSRLRHEAAHDSLTGLPNSTRLLERMDELLTEGQPFGLLLVGLDTMHEVVDTLGHTVGDLLLGEVGRRLEAHATLGATVARVGADFAVLLPLPSVRTTGAVDEALARRLDILDSAAEVLAAAEGTRLLELVTRSYHVDTVVLDLPMTAGVATYPRHGDDATTLLQRAAGGLYAARRAGLPLAVWNAAHERSDTRQLALAGELRRLLDGGLGCGSLEVHYQPTVALSTGELVGAEALVRWEHPVHGMLPPDEFISMAERTGLVAPLTRFVLARALARCVEWEQSGLVLRIAVNLSQRALYEPGFADHVHAALWAAGLPADRLTLELTESGVMNDPVRALPPLQALADLGVHLSVDDFGTGYSSLAYLRRLPVDEIKIDKSFVFSMGSSDGDTAIVETIIGLGHSLGLQVVAEGVEDEVSRNRLREMGCDIAQGYLISRPLAPDRFDAWVRTRTEWVESHEGLPARRLRVVGED